MNVLSSSFGQPISKADADKLIKPLDDLRRHKEILKSLETIPDVELRKTALKLFTGNGFAFIFTKDILSEILKTLDDNKETALVMYGGLDKEKNRPTLIGFVYQERGNNFEVIASSFSGKDGVEHPGAFQVASASIPTSIPTSSIAINLF